MASVVQSWGGSLEIETNQQPDVRDPVGGCFHLHKQAAGRPRASDEVEPALEIGIAEIEAIRPVDVVVNLVIEIEIEIPVAQREVRSGSEVGLQRPALPGSRYSTSRLTPNVVVTSPMPKSMPGRNSTRG
ncbi:MAG TPA: hypothetical protein VFO21_00575 [Vicinamibacterales bacterium]|nr:hypothetical protein [Vicinamibacterales bacterium]